MRETPANAHQTRVATHAQSHCGNEARRETGVVFGGQKRPRPFRECRLCDCGSHGFVGLTKGFVALFSPGRLDEVSERNWYINSIHQRHAVTSSRRGKMRMHRLLTDAPDGLDVDHHNHDTLDNRDENLRVCTRSQNLANRVHAPGKSFKGICNYTRGRWKASIQVDGEKRHIGYFGDPISAAIAYDKAALDAFGEYALTNASLGLLTVSSAIRLDQQLPLAETSTSDLIAEQTL